MFSLIEIFMLFLKLRRWSADHDFVWFNLLALPHRLVGALDLLVLDASVRIIRIGERRQDSSGAYVGIGQHRHVLDRDHFSSFTVKWIGVREIGRCVRFVRYFYVFAVWLMDRQLLSWLSLLQAEAGDRDAFFWLLLQLMHIAIERLHLGILAVCLSNLQILMQTITFYMSHTVDMPSAVFSGVFLGSSFFRTLIPLVVSKFSLKCHIFIILHIQRTSVLRDFDDFSHFVGEVHIVQTVLKEVNTGVQTINGQYGLTVH